MNSHIRWVIFIDEYLTSEYMSAFYCQPHVQKFIKDLMTNMTHAQGVGRHSNEEVFKMIVFDIYQLAAILGLFYNTCWTSFCLVKADNSVEVK